MSLADDIIQTGKALKDSQPITEQAAEAFSLFTRAITGATTAYANFGEGSVLFSQQYDRSIGAIKNTDAFKIASDQAGVLSKGLEKLGLSVPKKIIDEGLEAVENYAKNLLKGADNAIRLQGEFLKMSAATGNLSNVFQTAGGNLENLNALVQKQAQVMTEATGATGVSGTEVEAYYMSLGKIPGALDSIVEANSRSGGSLNMLTAAIKLAHGSGRDMKDIIDDLSTAYNNYGLKGKDALKFSARFGEVANTLEVPLKNVRDELINLSGTFSKYVSDGEKAINMSEGLAKMTNEYVTALKAAGSTGINAVRITQEMIGGINNLNVAQKAFLSGQTGGPGGLMGAFQIDKMLREGNIEGVMKMAQQQMTKQFGKIVSLDEAASSQSAAAQYQKQIQIMTSGPLGGMVKTSVDAERMIDAMQKQQRGEVSVTGLKDNVLTEAIDNGTKIEEKSYTVMASMAADIEGIARSVDFLTLNILQKTITASGGTPGTGSSKDMDDLKNQMAARAKRGAGATTEFSGRESVYQYTTDSINSLIENMSKVPQQLKNIAKYGTKLSSGSDQDKKAYYGSLEGIKQDIESKKSMKMDARATKDYEIEIEAYNRAKKIWQEQGDVNIGSAKNLDKTKLNPAVNRNIGYTTEDNSTYQGTSKDGKPGQQTVRVLVEGYCIKCKNEIDKSGQSRAVNAATGQ